MISLLVALLIAHPGYARDIEKASLALEADPDNVAVLVVRADYSRRAGAFGDARMDLARAHCLDPNLPEVWLSLALTEYDMGDLPAAESWATAYLETGGASVKAHWTRARIRSARGDVNGALADFDAALAPAAHIDIYLERAAMLRQADRLDEALAGLQHGVAASGSDVLRAELAELLLEMGRNDDVIGLCDAAVARTRVSTQWLLLRARAHEAAGRPEAALADRENAFARAQEFSKLRPGALAARNLARVFLALGRYSDAKRVLATLVDADADDADTLNLQRRAAAGER